MPPVGSAAVRDHALWGQATGGADPSDGVDCGIGEGNSAGASPRPGQRVGACACTGTPTRLKALSQSADWSDGGEPGPRWSDEKLVVGKQLGKNTALNLIPRAR